MRAEQTIVRFYRQLLEMGYADADLARVRDCYELVAGLHAARFRPNGRPFLCHLVGTASILAELGAEPDLVLTGLLHGAYDHGDFGDGTRGIDARKRAVLREAVGDRLEARVAAFCEFGWSGGDLAPQHRRCEALDEPGRETLLVRLANELEELLDLEIQFRRDAEARLVDIGAGVEFLIELAHRLDQPALASAFAEAGAQCVATRLPAWLRNPIGANHDRIPRSLGRRPARVVAEFVTRSRALPARVWARARR